MAELVVVIKIGGAQIDSPGKMRRIASDIKKLIENGQQLAIIHGGGKDIDFFFAKAGIET